ncbi:unnamed protein product [Symbiodinium microadriaticum]|nr:unnamed protein product [Symbiodinium microadriaticum]
MDVLFDSIFILNTIQHNRNRVVHKHVRHDSDICNAHHNFNHNFGHGNAIVYAKFIRNLQHKRDSQLNEQNADGHQLYQCNLKWHRDRHFGHVDDAVNNHVERHNGRCLGSGGCWGQCLFGRCGFGFGRPGRGEESCGQELACVCCRAPL